MKKLHLLFLALAFGLITFVSADAQVYKSAIGARLGYPLSASYKTFISNSSALEGYVGFRGYSAYRWISINGAYLIHRPIEGVTNLQWYFGGGAGVYFYTYDTGFFEPGSSTSFGLQGYIGLDYTFEDLPLNLTVDWIPTIFLNGFNNGFGGSYGSLGVRYVLGR